MERIPFPLGDDDPLDLLGRGEEDRAFRVIEGLIEDPLNLDAWLEYLAALRGPESPPGHRIPAEALEVNTAACAPLQSILMTNAA